MGDLSKVLTFHRLFLKLNRFILQATVGSPHPIKATSHTRLRARDQYPSSTPIGGKGGDGPSSLHTMLEGPTEYVNGKMDGKSTWIPYMASNGSCFMVTWDYCQKTIP